MLEFLVQLNPNLQELIALGLTALVSFLILKVAEVLPWLAEYLGGHKVGIVVWLTGIVVQFLQAKLDRVPESWDTVLTLAMQLIVEVAVIMVSFGYLARVKGVQSLS